MLCRCSAAAPQVPPIATLKTQIVPCISINDFMELVMLGSGTAIGAALSIDIRTRAEYLAGCLESDSVNIPFAEVRRRPMTHPPFGIRPLDSSSDAL